MSVFNGLVQRDFSVFFDSKVFRNFVDAFRAFQVCRQIRTATHLPKPFKKTSHSKIIYKAIDAIAFWVDLNLRNILTILRIYDIILSQNSSEGDLYFYETPV